MGERYKINKMLNDALFKWGTIEYLQNQGLIKFEEIDNGER